MCGRYAAAADPDELVEEFDLEFIGQIAEVAAPRYNVAPTDPIATIFVDEVDGRLCRQLGVSRWGLVPPWSTDKPMSLINARVETVNEKPSFRSAVRARRCILPALGYYEWKPEERQGKRVKQPYFLRPRSGQLAMAGIFEYHRGAEGWVRTTSILTTEATDEFGWLHDRMPMMVPRDSFSHWLDRGLTDGVEAVSLLEVPRLQRPYPVSRDVNSVEKDGAHLVDPEACRSDSAQGSLFS